MLTTIDIDLEKLKKNSLNEVYAAQFAAQLKYLLGYLAAPGRFSSMNMSTPSGAGRFSSIKLEETDESAPKGVRITGSKKDLESFSDVVAQEKKYMDSYIEHGLGSPDILDDKLALEKAVHSFERQTGLKWPLT
tara:strand:+ start:37 stop:438 length:402 start_codon:yes stop_codon:yes gene_type:complete